MPTCNATLVTKASDEGAVSSVLVAGHCHKRCQESAVVVSLQKTNCLPAERYPSCQRCAQLARVAATVSSVLAPDTQRTQIFERRTTAQLLTGRPYVEARNTAQHSRRTVAKSDQVADVTCTVLLCSCACRHNAVSKYLKVVH